jgi:hypothetical protein
MRNVASLLACGLLLSGCVVAPAAVVSGDAVTQAIAEGGKFVGVLGPRVPQGEPFLGVAGTNFHALRSWIDRRTGETVHQLYVEESYSGPKRDWDAAQESIGKPLRFIPISSKEITCAPGCSYAEEFAAALPEQELRANPQGITVFFSAKSGAQMAIPVSGDLIAKQLAGVDAARRASVAAGAPPR